MLTISLKQSDLNSDDVIDFAKNLDCNIQKRLYRSIEDISYYINGLIIIE